jgi:5-methylcytosine-specific restriction protein A
LVLRLYGDVCHICGESGTDAVDHVEPGDDHSPENCRPIHQDVPPFCHRYKSAQEGVAARAARRAARFRAPERHPGSRG